MIPGLERSPGEEIGYPLQYSRVSLVTQIVKNLPAMHEDMGSIPGLKRPLEEGMVFLPGEPPWTEEPGGLQSMGLQRVSHVQRVTTERLSTTQRGRG